MSEISTFLNQLCDAVGDEILLHFRKKLEVENKFSVGFDPVTIADQGAEKIIRGLIEKTYPEHGIIGEETGNSNEGAEYQWVIDPIDGTRSFISGLPTWGTLIGLYKGGTPIEGIFFQPFTGERYYTHQGKSFGTVQGGERFQLKTSAVDKLNGATIMSTDPAIFEDQERISFENLQQKCQLSRYGYDCYAYAMLAAGNIDLVVEAGLFIYDIAALIPIIENAGGKITNWQGGSPAQGGQVIAAANAVLHQAALDVLNK